MLTEDYNVLTELLEDLKREAGEADRAIEANLRRIRETEAYVEAFTDAESEDFKVFSPRRAEVLHKEELQDARQRILAYQRENEELTERRKLLHGRMGRLRELLDHMERETQRQVREAGELQAKTLQSLRALAERIDRSSACIERNPIQARQEFAIIGKSLRELAEEMDNV